MGISSAYQDFRLRHEASIKELGLTFRILVGDRLALFGICVILMFLILALFAPWIARSSPYTLNVRNSLQPPGLAHLFGTDSMGRDVLTRVIYGSQDALIVGIVIVGIGASVGVVVGSYSGYTGGRASDALMRTTDIFLAFPSLVLALGLTVVMGGSLWNAILAVSIVYWPGYARLFYAQTLSAKENNYVIAAQLMGASKLRILSRHILPNIISPVIIKGTLDMGDAILLTAALSFLGLGAQPPAADWGAMISLGTNNLLDGWWISTFPGIAIGVLVLGFNLLGDGVRDALDPTFRRRTKMKSKEETSIAPE